MPSHLFSATLASPVPEPSSQPVTQKTQMNYVGSVSDLALDPHQDREGLVPSLPGLGSVCRCPPMEPMDKFLHAGVRLCIKPSAFRAGNIRFQHLELNISAEPRRRGKQREHQGFAFSSLWHW